MIFLYIFLILLAAFPLVLTIWRMRKEAFIKKNGIHTNGNVTHRKTVRIKNTSIDILTIEYKDRATGRAYNAKASVSQGKYSIGDVMEVIYLPNDPAKNAIDTKKGYWFILIFCIILFAFVVFAIYKIDEMLKGGQM